MPSLTGKIAVVTGASRGVGRGIALVLGECGATVYVTGRSSRAAGSTEDIAGTIDETAELVTARGGQGIAVRCDHTNDADTEALFARVRDEAGRLDLLVNNAWGGYERYEANRFDAPFWEQPRSRWESMFVAGLRAHLVAAQLAAPLMVEKGSGVIIGTTAYDRGLYTGQLFYDIAKNAVCRMAFGMATELRPHGVTALALAPGFVRTERVLMFVPEPPKSTESPEYVGRAVAALAVDPDVISWSGQTLNVGDVAREYGFTDVDGRQVPVFRIDEPM